MAYGEDFWGDCAKAKKAERILFDVCNNALDLDYVVELKTDDQTWWHKGDVAVTTPDGAEIGIDTKDDGVCYRTGNIFVEERIQRGYYWGKGWVHSDYDVLAIVSQPEHKIYFIDFARLKAEYKQLRFRANVPSYFAAHTCWGSLVKLNCLRAKGLMIAEIEYEGDEQQGFWAKETEAKTA